MDPIHYQVNQILNDNLNTYLIKDSIAFYPFLMKLNLIKDVDNKVKVAEIKVTDSLVFKVSKL